MVQSFKVIVDRNRQNTLCLYLTDYIIVKYIKISLGVGTPTEDLIKLLLLSSLMISMQSSTHSSQIKTVGPAINFLTSLTLSTKRAI